VRRGRQRKWVSGGFAGLFLREVITLEAVLHVLEIIVLRLVLLAGDLEARFFQRRTLDILVVLTEESLAIGMANKKRLR
jgi:hypothetical protein